VVGADKEQFDKLKNNLKHSGIKVIRQNNLNSEFEQLTLVIALAFPAGKVEAAIDQIVYTTLVQGGNQFYTDSAGLYFPVYKPKMLDIFTNSCSNHLITLTTFEDNFFSLTLEQFTDVGQTFEYVSVGEYHGTYNFTDKTLSAYIKNGLIFTANEYYEPAVQAVGLEFLSTTIPQINGACRIVKRKNHS
jgi:hypothetical protein